MAHHYSGPDFSFPHGDARVDHCDLFAFPSPEDASRSVLAIDVHPSFGINPPGPTTTEPFSPEAVYELKVDTNGDSIADVAFRARVSVSDGAQTVDGSPCRGRRCSRRGRRRGGSRRGRARVYRSGGAGDGDGAVPVLRRLAQRPVLLRRRGGSERFPAQRPGFLCRQGRVQHRAGGAERCVGSSGRSRDLAPHARSVPRHRRCWVQVDRGARPSQSVFFSPGEEKAEYLGGEPATDTRFVDSFAHVLEQVGGYPPEDAKRVAATLLPDVLPYDPAQPAAYPHNGRALTDDVADHFSHSSRTGRWRTTVLARTQTCWTSSRISDRHTVRTVP